MFAAATTDVLRGDFGELDREEDVDIRRPEGHGRSRRPAAHAEPPSIAVTSPDAH
jgi:hypothetical protein